MKATATDLGARRAVDRGLAVGWWSAARGRSTAELLAAVAASWAVHRFLPLAGEDPFYTTVCLLPLLVAVLRALERHGPRSPRAIRAASGRIEGAMLAGLLLLTLGRQSLGLAATDWFLAAAFLLLLAHRVTRLLLLWRPALTGGGPHPAFFVLPLVVYLALLPWQAEHRQVDGDEPFYLLLTHSLVYDLDADLANNYANEDWRAFMDRPIEPQPGDPRGVDGEIYSRHNTLLPILLAPAYRLGGRWGAMVLMAVFTAALAWTVLRLARREGSPAAALLTYGVFAFSPPLVYYSYQIWIEIPAALIVALAFDRIRQLQVAAPPSESPVAGGGRPSIAGLVVLLALLPLLKLRLGLVALPLAGLAVYRLRPPRRSVLLLGGGLTLALLGLFAHNQLRYGNLLKIHRWDELHLYSSSLDAFARGGFGLFYDVAFGLFPNAPIYFLLLPAAWLLVRRRNTLALDVAVVTLPYLAAIAPRFEWYGGWSPPFRYPLVFLPLFALALVPLFELRRRPGLGAVFAGLLAMTLVLTLIAVIVPGWTYNFADGRTHLLDQAGARFQADLARLFPSTIRPRPATWLWPPLSLLLVPLALWNPRRGNPTGRWWRGRSRIAVGVAGVLLAAALLPLAARHTATRVIEVEDAWVSKERGLAFPETWVLQRPRYRSGWVVPPRGRVIARVAPGGDQVRLRLAVRALKAEEPTRLRVAAGERQLAVVRVRPGPWRELELGPFDWPRGEPLVISGGGPRFPGRAALDRIECTWQ